MVNKNSLETGRICVMEGSRQVLVKVMLFQLQEHFHPHDGATPNFFNESRSSLLVLSIDVSFVSKFLWKGDKNFENQTSGPIYMEDPVLLKCNYLWCINNVFDELHIFEKTSCSRQSIVFVS